MTMNKVDDKVTILPLESPKAEIKRVTGALSKAKKGEKLSLVEIDGLKRFQKKMALVVCNLIGINVSNMLPAELDALGMTIGSLRFHVFNLTKQLKDENTLKVLAKIFVLTKYDLGKPITNTKLFNNEVKQVYNKLKKSLGEIDGW